MPFYVLIKISGFQGGRAPADYYGVISLLKKNKEKYSLSSCANGSPDRDRNN